MAINRSSNVVKIETCINHETGELLEQSLSYAPQAEDNYVKYYEPLDKLCTSPTTLVVFIQITRLMTYSDFEAGEQTVHITKFEREMIADKCNIKENTVTKAVKELVDINAIKRIGTGVYRVNPFIAGKGSWKNILTARKRYNDGR